MKRNISFWTRYTWESMEVNLGMTGIFALLTLFGADQVQLQQFAAAVPYLLCVAAIFGMLMINTGSQTLYVPLLLSMGETRRNVLLGFHYYRTLIISVTLALCALVWLVAPGEVSAIGLSSIPTILCVLVIAASVGSILGTLFVKWKWLGMVVIIVLCGGFGGMMGMTAVNMAKGIDLAVAVELAGLLAKLPWWLIAAAAGFLALDVAFQWLLLRRQEVKL